ncbi:DUF4328 domain-containing protein [Pseudaestuariivita rosea]|uniref:DUF4328 domain-containing protein n=1 Tax=Pseudaestuariivita rosea TaxID=2763263 RepID=UPI001ABAA120|nr:DUF4328 domain-containing protein [Pseudaestuariivita rosea]
MTDKHPEFRDPSTRLAWVKWTTYLTLFCGTLSFIIEAVMGFLLLDLFLSTDTVMILIVLIPEYLSIAATILLIASFISFMMWMYRAANNALALGADDFKVMPVFVTGSKLIPILHLWIPFMALRNIWKVSRKLNEWRQSEIPLVFYIWWITSFLLFTTYICLIASLLMSEFIWTSTSLINILALIISVAILIISLFTSMITSVMVAQGITRDQQLLHSRSAFD